MAPPLRYVVCGILDRMDPDDWNALFALRRRALVDGARRITGDVAEAEDVVQDAWLKVHEAPATPRSPAAWLATLVRHLALDRLRQREAVRRMTARLAAEPSATSNDPNDAHDTRRAVAAALVRMAALLSEADVVMLVLREVFGEDLETLARLSRRSAGALRVALHRALKRLRETSSQDDAPLTLLTPRVARTFAICWQALEARDAALLRAVLVDACRASAPDELDRVPAVRMAVVNVDGRFQLALRQGGRPLCMLPIGSAAMPDPAPA